MTDAGSPVSYAYADGVARITLTDGGRGNPVDLDSVAALTDAVLRARSDAARVVVLAAEGRFFSVGGDLAAFAGADDVGRYIDDLADALHRVISELQRLPAVVVSVVQGTAAGAGFPLAAAADVVLAADTAVFALAYGKVGLSPDGGSSLLVHTLGLHRTLRMALLHDTLSAADALAAGLVARVVPVAELAATAEEIVSRLAGGSGPAQAAAKRLVRTAAEAEIETRLRAETLSIRELAVGADGREGVQAFLEKRAPRFGA
ncbi:enoyl-CoA hydratase/isomerase family protein [Nocardioides massiliensis]|uniref:2-(1,2-epoxy-1,2-dihydrophenyl)acetyl-CoA isomerase n=1 Tax=Nocardioides massiliensis TaxID=1325935 RepID=A0ABT9NQF0_9ACTN|nr:enoyl-CoA hydratase-related protein [Nocardioides massiliensis]MDP9822497.1 2-(1,2-epoxy-1,2-dihydrophenyl)acetyl-CoA isomerase [Nocardioides massiliensis]